MDHNSENETVEASKNSALLYTVTALAAVGAAVVVTKTIRFTAAVITVTKQNRNTKKLQTLTEELQSEI